MVLAACGTTVAESTIEAEARLEVRGTPIEELERLARLFNLVAEIQEVTVADLPSLLAAEKWPIAYLDRAIFALKLRQRARHRLRAAKIHTVIPIRVTAAFVAFHDPLRPGVTRKSIRLFRLAYERLGGYCVVCSKKT
jgi:hypothetical protein